MSPGRSFVIEFVPDWPPWVTLGQSLVSWQSLTGEQGPHVGLCEAAPGLEALLEDLQEASELTRGCGADVGSMETVTNERERMEMDGNKPNPQAGSEVKIYLKAKTYD